MATKTPLLFGVDPDETWGYIPEVAREAGLKSPVFTLKAPSLALATKRQSLLSKKRSALYAEIPDVIDELTNLFGEKWEKPGDEADASLREKYQALNKRWSVTWEKITKDLEAEAEVIESEYLSTCVAKWTGLPSKSGKDLDFERLKDRIPEVIRGSLREEIIGAIERGATLTSEELEGLPSTPA